MYYLLCMEEREISVIQLVTHMLLNLVSIHISTLSHLYNYYFISLDIDCDVY